MLFDVFSSFLSLWAAFFLRFESIQRWQVQIYGWLLEQNGHKVNEVALVAIPRDGEMADIRVHKEKYDAPTAEAGIAWLEEIKSLIASDAPAPEPEESLFFCTKYCSYYDQTGEVGCPSMKRYLSPAPDAR